MSAPIFTIEVTRPEKPISASDYTFAGVIYGYESHALYFYGHSAEELISKFLTYMLEKAP